MCLCVGTGLIFHNLFLFYLMTAIFTAPEVTNTMQISEYVGPLLHSSPMRNAYSSFMWNCVFSVKLCFFAFFKGLVWPRRRLTIYYWISVIFTFLAWAICFSETFIFNRFTRADFSHRDLFRLSLNFTIVLAFVDIVSDILSMVFFGDVVLRRD